MEDSFFGFDTSLPLDDDGQIEEQSEEEYDALNDETFGSAINGDWEEAHESLVRLTDRKNGDDLLDSSEKLERRFQPILQESSTFGKIGSKRFDTLADADLDLNLSRVKLDDVDINFDNDSENTIVLGGIKVDSSVWGSNATLTHNLLTPQQTTCAFLANSQIGSNSQLNPDNFLRQNFLHPFQQRPVSDQNLQNGVVRSSSVFGSPIPPSRPNAPKICTLEDIEKNMIMQQMQKQQKKQVSPQQNLMHEETSLHSNHQNSTELMQQLQQQQSKPSVSIVSQKQQLSQKGPPGFGTQIQRRPQNNFANNMSQHPFGSMLPQPPANLGNRFPPGLPLPVSNAMPGHNTLPTHPFLNQHALPINFPYPVSQHTLPNPHLPVALNNFAMHPNFSALRAAATGLYPALVPHAQGPRCPPNQGNQATVLNNTHPNSMSNIFNMRLVQEIQQNHPMLQNIARQPLSAFQHGQLLHQQQRNIHVAKQTLQRSANGNLPHEEIDEYANLMSTRDKHWLISIQLSQLNTDTPYIDDYYYTMYKEKHSTTSGTSRHSQAHKDNQLNHPLTQPKGHAQLILVQLGNKNGTRNGQHRERRSSEASNIANSIGNISDQKAPYVFTPLKFENSLGKLQYGSVTAPRKIIDAEIMSSGEIAPAENSENFVNNKGPTPRHGIQIKSTALNVALGTSVSGNVISDVTLLAQRKSRHILLHIETLYRIVLKLEDLDNPNAIATILAKMKKENERIAALELLENSNKTPEERASDGSSTQVRKFAYEIESKEALLEKLVAGLTIEKVNAMMNVRKGKILIRRILSFVHHHNIRWQIWAGVFASLQSVVKKDREDIDGMLYALYVELKNHINDANFETIVKLSRSLPTNDKKSNIIFCSRFVITSLVCLIIRAEEIYVAACDVTFSKSNKNEWRQFLGNVATSLNKTIQNQTICAAIESDCIQPMMNHFARFEDLKLDSLLALVTEAKQQIN